MNEVRDRLRDSLAVLGLSLMAKPGLRIIKSPNLNPGDLVNSTEDENLTAADTNPPPPLEPNPASTTTPTSKEVRGPAPALNRKQRRKAEFRSQKILTFKRKEFQAFKENQEAEAEKKRQKKKATAKMKAKARR